MKADTKDYLQYIKKQIMLSRVCEDLGIHADRHGTLALCPFHDDKKPSLHIFPDHYHCFACGAHGDIFNLVQEMKGMDFPAALAWIESQYSVDLTAAPKPVRSENHSVKRNPFQIAQGYYAAAASHESLQKEAADRGYTPEFLRSAEIYGTDGTVLINHMSRSEQDDLLSANLLRRNYNAPASEAIIFQDYFSADRILFSLRNIEHELVGFAGRSQSEDAKAKYLFTKGLPKDRLLYRLDAVASRWSQPEKTVNVYPLYLVEGLFDALRLESLGIAAAAVLGSKLTVGQIQILEQFAAGQQKLGRSIELVLFFDRDDAGRNGTYKALQALWRSDRLRYVPLKIIFAPSYENCGKDPDEIFKDKTVADPQTWLKEHQLHPLEFLLRYQMDDQSLLFDGSGDSLREQFAAYDFSLRVCIFNRLAALFGRKLWASLLQFYQDSGKTDDDRFALEQFTCYFLSKPKPQPTVPKGETGGIQPYLLALETAQTSSKREGVPIDEDSWKRLQAGIDMLGPHFDEQLRNNRHLLWSEKPLLAFNEPKNEDTDRLKVLPAHEESLLQHYVLIELLSEDSYPGYAQNVPAVRYDPQLGAYTTGKNYTEIFEQKPYRAVSFAYQIDMPVLRRERRADNGIFRSYYACWKDFIAFLQEGIELMDQDKIYRARLDIRGYYDYIRKHAIRDVLISPLLEAFGYTDEKFRKLFLDRANRAEAVVDIILEGLFGWSYVDPMTGRKKEAGDPLTGIPQGPALSAYAANVLLFPLDQAVMRYIDEVNAGCSEGTIRACYARYVDDMIVITSDPFVLHEIDRIIREQLYKIDLELSTKTDHADSIDKESAIQWLRDKRGGLGVSGAQLAPEDVLGELWGSWYEPYAVDRRDTLKILRGTKEILQPDKGADGTDFFKAVAACFKTEDIRYRDAVRMSKFILEQLLTANLDTQLPSDIGALYKDFGEIWQDGMDGMAELQTLLSREDVKPMAFLDGLIELLKSWVPSILPLEERSARIKQIRIAAEHVADWKCIQQALEAYGAAQPAGQNAAVLRIKCLQLSALALKILPSDSAAQGKLYEHCKGDFREAAAGQRYFQRWQYSVMAAADPVSTNPLFHDLQENSADVYQEFHFLTLYLGFCDSRKKFKELGSVFWGHKTEEQFTAPYLRRIMAVWFWGCKPEGVAAGWVEHGEKRLAEIALRTLSNFVCKPFLPEVIGENSVIRHVLFPDDKEQYHYLPVPPGVDYPGIFAISGSMKKVFRADFRTFDDSRYGVSPPVLAQKWQYIPKPEGGTEDAWKIYCADAGEAGWKPLKQPLPFPTPEKPWVPAVVNQIVELYQKLCSLLKNGIPGCALSKHQLFWMEDGELCALTYYDNNQENDIAGVALADQTSFLRWCSLGAGPGKTERAAALLLQDILALEQFPEDDFVNGRVWKILDFGLNRLTGNHMRKYLPDMRSKSFEQTVTRTLEKLTSFANATEDRIDCILLDIPFENELMSLRKEQGDAELRPGEDSMLLQAWAMNVMQRLFPQIQEVLRNHPENLRTADSPLPLRRVTAVWKGLGTRLFQLGTASDCKTVRALGAAALMESVAHDLRTRTLECVRLLNEEELLILKNKEHPLPQNLISEYGGNPLLLRNSKSSAEAQANQICDLMIRYRGGRGSSTLERITPIGWCLTLIWVTQLDVEWSVQYRRSSWLGISSQHKSIIWNAWNKTSQYLFPSETQQEEETFPYQGLTALLHTWTPSVTEELLSQWREADAAALGFSIQKQESPDLFLGSGDRTKPRIALKLGRAEQTNYPTQFVSFFHAGDQMSWQEKNGDALIWTQTMREGDILSISAVSQEAANLIEAPLSERSSEMPAPRPSEGAEAPLNAAASEETGIPPDITAAAGAEDSSPAAASVTLTDQLREEPAQDIQESGITAAAFYTQLKTVQEIQLSRWRERECPYSSTDRIALFQFDVDDSYVHPLAECCIQLPNQDLKKIKRDPASWNARKANNHHQEKRYSCSEFRRRELLKKAFFICQTFGVDILVLPEYSVRPETAQWIFETIRDHMEYKFSVWAGTCRLMPGRNHDGSAFSKLADASHDYSAVLPIICGKPSKEFSTAPAAEYPKLMIDRFKKYPSIAMEETINPMSEPLKPVMKSTGHLFGDARDDVMELICAEVFLATNPANIVSFANVFGTLRARFTPNGMVGSMVHLLDTVTTDIMEIGKHTALQQLKPDRDTSEKLTGTGKYGRTPILLVPAYTSRGVDYHVSGQMAYLAAGLTTVFCDAVGLNSHGESCFIGTDSWEKRDGKKGPFMPDYSLYNGALPGIYRQFDPKQGHGALGKTEQAIVICDVNPEAALGKPRPESMTHPLTLVAHLPVIESQTYRKATKLKNGTHCGAYDQCRCSRAKGRIKPAPSGTKEADYLDGTARTVFQLFEIIQRFAASEKTTADDAEPRILADCLEKLGLELDSPGLIERSKCYRRFHKSNPQAMPPATLLDWVWVDVEYPEAAEDSSCKIDVPRFAEDTGEFPGNNKWSEPKTQL